MSNQLSALTPTNLSEAMQFADMLSRSAIVPKDYQGNSGNVLVAMQWGFELGLQPMQAMQNIAVINGRPSIWGDAMIALVRGSGLLEYIKETPTDEGCTCEIKRKGEEPVIREFTKTDAKTAGLLGKSGPWQQYPKRMMQMRARAFALRDVFPDVLKGVYVAEEARDMPAEVKDMGTAETVSPAPAEKPKSKTEAVKAKLTAKKKTEADVLLQDVMSAISLAQTEAELMSAAEMAKKLEADGDRTVARDAFSKKRLELKEQTDAETGEITQPVMTFAQVADAIAKAKTQDDLDIAADNIRYVREDQQAELTEMLKKKNVQ